MSFQQCGNFENNVKKYPKIFNTLSLGGVIVVQRCKKNAKVKISLSTGGCLTGLG